MCANRATHLDRQKIERLKKEAGVQSPLVTGRKTFKNSNSNSNSKTKHFTLDSPLSGSKKEN
jgi:hypothetical protein